MYAGLLRGLIPHLSGSGTLAALLAERPERPMRDALPLRLLGTVHALVLAGDEADLARHYPSVGGTPGPGLVETFLAAVERNVDAVRAGLGRTVQTNEVGRAAALAPGIAWAVRRSGGLPVRLREIGTSAGLNLRLDAFRYEPDGVDPVGPADTPVRFGAEWWTTPVPLVPVVVVDRAGCDVAPLDPTTPRGERTLLSFVWPDQSARFARIAGACALAARIPAPVVTDDAGTWLEEVLADPGAGAPAVTVVMHSIAWQYFSPATKDRVRAALGRAGQEADATHPLVWLRLEPAGRRADLRATWWPGGDETILAEAGYHGADVTWRGEPAGATG